MPSITLFKTPFNDEYRDIIDVLPKGVTFYDFLLQSFEHSAEFTTDKDREYAYDEEGFSFSMTVSSSLIEDNRGTFPYNYIAFKKDDEDKWNFFFIIGFKLENRLFNKVKYTLDLKRDVWHSLFEDIREDLFKFPQAITRSHRHTAIYDTLGISYETTNDIFDTQASNYEEKLSYKYSFNILWLKFRIDTNVLDVYTSKFWYGDVEVDSDYITQSIYTSSMPVCYIPIAMFNNDKTELLAPTTDITFSIQSGTYGKAYSRDTLVAMLIWLAKQNFVKDMSLTYLVPFDYELQYYDDNNLIFFKFPNRVNIDLGELSYGADLSKKYHVFACCGLEENAMANDTFTRTVQLVDNPEFTNIDFNEGYDENYDYQILNTYPYKYKEIRIGDFSYIMQRFYKYIDISVNNFVSDGFFVRIEAYNKTDKSDIITLVDNAPINVSYRIPFNTNALESYLNEYGSSQILIKTLQTGMGAVTPFFSHGKQVRTKIGKKARMVGDVTNSVSSILNYGSYIADLSAMNKRTTSYDTTDGSIYLRMLDDIVIVTHEIANPFIIKQIKEDFKRYGYKGFRYESPVTDSRLVYDYVETDNCILPICVTDYDRKTLEEMFDRGVTKWHYTLINPAPYIGKYDVNNPPYANNFSVMEGFVDYNDAQVYTVDVDKFMVQKGEN